MSLGSSTLLNDSVGVFNDPLLKDALFFQEAVSKMKKIPWGHTFCYLNFRSNWQVSKYFCT